MFTAYIFPGCNNIIDPDSDEGVITKLRNNSPHDLNNLLIADKKIGCLPAGTVSKYHTFKSFTIEGYPDEDASSEINGKLLPNYYRGY